MKIIAQNKKAFHDYFIEDRYETGVVLTGTEVKSVKAGRANIKESYAEIENGEVFLKGMHISPYKQGSLHNEDPLRVRKLLLNRKEIQKLVTYISQKGYTLIPTKIYTNDRGLIKLELGIAKGKKNYDKRNSLAEKDAKRKVERALTQKDY